ncbi:MAG: flagellar hook-length control protein FliK [Rheinheimera sp.]|nr:flagellar hook-length control protein FliK [Rheinheimera sp.]
MNQINIDSLLQIGSGVKIEQSLKLDSSQLYQALLQIGRDQDARLTVQTPQGPLQIPLPQNTAQQILQTAQQIIAAATPQPQATAQTQTQSQTSGQQAQTSPAQTQPANTVMQTPGSSQTQHAQAPVIAQPPGTATVAHEVKLFVQLQPLGMDQLLLTVRQAGKTLTMPLQASQLLQLLQQPAPGPQQHFSVQAQQLAANSETNKLQWPVQLSRQGQQLIIQLPQGQPVAVDLSLLPQAKQWPEQRMVPARFELQQQHGQLKLQLQLTDHSKAGDTAAPVAAAGKPASPTGTNSEHAIPAAIALKPALQQQLVPLLARQTWPEQLGTDMKHWLSHARVAAPAANAQSWLWQLKHPGQQQLQLELTPQIEPRQLKLSVSDISRPFSFLPASTAIPAATTLKSDSRELWRQWLPLSQANPDLLADSPLLSAPVRQVLQELRTQHPDAAKLLTQQQLMQQINAALQFNPLQTPAQPNSAAGGLAIAIQLLLGRLGAQLPTERQNLPQKEKLQQLVGQLDRSQSAQLLRQLSGHSSHLQSAQIANVEQQANPATSQKPEQQLLIQLPLLQQGESRFTELAISEREADGSDNRSQQRCWQLTMKFDLGQQGEMLVQVRLIGKEVSLQFYADNEKTVQDTGQFLPLFKDRLTMQGLQVAEAGCQLGKIPEHLYQRGTSLLQVRV